MVVEPVADAIRDGGGREPEPLAEHLARQVAAWGGEDGLVGQCGYSAIGAVVAAKDAESTMRLRAMLPQSILLIPGYKTQGTQAEDVARAVAAIADPDMAPNTPLPAMTVQANPPGKKPTNLSSAENRRSLTPVFPSNEPMKINRGMEMRVNEFSEYQHE